MELTGLWILVIGTVAAALVFDAINGFHDAANSIATVVSTRVLSPRTAVLWAAFFNFVAMFVFAPKVADTISKIVHVQQGDPVYVEVVLAGLVGAIAWDLLTWWWSLPTSSSHALIGGFAGAGIAFKGWDAVHWDKLWTVMLFIPIAPLIGFAFGFGFMVAVYWICRKATPRSVDRWFRRLQLASAAAYTAYTVNGSMRRSSLRSITARGSNSGICPAILHGKGAASKRVIAHGVSARLMGAPLSGGGGGRDPERTRGQGECAGGDPGALGWRRPVVAQPRFRRRARTPTAEPVPARPRRSTSPSRQGAESVSPG